MDYLDVLRRGSWLPDPGDRVSVLPLHAVGCPARRGGTCACTPRLVLVDAAGSEVADPRRRPSDHLPRAAAG